MKVTKESLTLYAITDRRWLGDRTLYEAVEEALQGGATFLQLREKDLDGEALRQEALSIRDLCRRYHVPFVIDDNVQMAQEIGADGVHVGQSDMQAGRVRKQLGEDKIIGVSARTVDQALQAQKDGADYLGVGAIFPTGSKDDAKTIDRDTLRQICEAVRIPVVAIGGISLQNVSELAGTGIAGISVISAIFAQPDIRGAATALKEATQKMLAK